jgi:parvulin-like peptidyl-prolyl isomerase
MSTSLHGVLLLLLLAPVRAEVVDRMVAVVNKQIILESELDQVAHVEFLLQGRPLDQLTDPEMGKVLERLIDQDLLQQQIAQAAMPDPRPEEMAARLRDVRSQIPGAEADEKWRAMLVEYGVTEHDVAAQLLAQVKILQFIDLRFRGLVSVDKTAIAAYYQEKLVPELRKKGVPDPPLDQVSERIEKIVIEQRVNELLNDWLQTLRGQAHIEKLNGAGATLGAEFFGTGTQSATPKTVGQSGAKIGAATGSGTGVVIIKTGAEK